MHCVFNSLEAFSKNKELSTPMQIGLQKMEIHRGQNINFLSLHEGIKVTEKTVMKVKRPVMIGMRSLFSRSLKEKETSRGMMIEKQSSRNLKERSNSKVTRRTQTEIVDRGQDSEHKRPVQGGWMEVDGAGSKLDKEDTQRRCVNTRLVDGKASLSDDEPLRRREKLKEMWRLALVRRLKERGEWWECDDDTLGIWSLAVLELDTAFKVRMEAEYPEEYPIGRNYHVLKWKEVIEHLRRVWTSLYTK